MRNLNLPLFVMLLLFTFQSINSLFAHTNEIPGYSIGGVVSNKKTKKVFATTNLLVIIGNQQWKVKTTETGEYWVNFQLPSEPLLSMNPRNENRIYFRIPLHDGAYRETYINWKKISPSEAAPDGLPHVTLNVVL